MTPPIPARGDGSVLLSDEEGNEAEAMLRRLQKEENPYALHHVIEHFIRRRALVSTSRAEALEDAVRIVDGLVYEPASRALIIQRIRALSSSVPPGE